jgi:hypothetical protein
VVGVALATGVLASFAFFVPVLYARPLSYDSWRTRIIFDDCGDVVGRFEVDGATRDVPEFEGVPPPSGWCWL